MKGFEIDWKDYWVYLQIIYFTILCCWKTDTNANDFCPQNWQLYLVELSHEYWSVLLILHLFVNSSQNFRRVCICVFWILFWTGGNILLILINYLNKISDTCSFYSYERRDYALFKKYIFWWIHRERTQQEGSHLPAKETPILGHTHLIKRSPEC